jgi:hypothetical protein
MTRVSIAVLLVAFVAACASSIPVRGDTTEVQTLIGHWEGSFKATDSDRHGTVVFDLAAGRHTGEGKVTLFTDTSESAKQSLRIKFVEVADGTVSGKIARYTDPSCNCAVDTQFSGLVSGDSISGEYKMSAVESATELRGNWTAERVAN